MNLSIVIPAYNEEKRIEKTLIEFANFFDARLKDKTLSKYEILVVINNTTDRTEDIVKKQMRKHKSIRYINLIRGGKGYATTEGFRESLKGKWEILGFVDSDLATRPEAFFDLVLHIGKGVDGAIASRYIPGAKVNPPLTFQRLISSRAFNFLIRSLFLMPYKDTQCGAKVFTRKAIQRTLPHLALSQWAFDVDLLYHLQRQKFRVIEVPTVWSDKEYSKINLLSAGPMMALGIIRLRMLHSPFKIFIRFYDRAVSITRKYL